MASITSAGIGSGLDVSGLVTQLVDLERRPLVILDKKEAAFQAKLSAYGSVKGALSAFQTAVRGLRDVSKFQVLTATPADTTVLTVSASSAAAPGSYAIEVTKLTQAQKLVAAGQASSTTAIGNGTLTIDFGTISGGTFDAGTGRYTGASFTSNGSGTKTVTIDGTNNTLAGIRDAVNVAKIGVTASIVNDGGASPYRLTLSSDKMGKANSVKITVSGDAALSNLLAHDPAATQNLSQTVTAQDAEFKVDGVSITKSSNTVTDVIAGVTLNLLKTNAGGSTTLTVARDTATVKASVGAFVKAYNDVNKTLKDLTAYNADTKTAAVLQGDASVRSIQSQIRATFTSALVGVNGAYTRLSDVGVSFQKDGTLAVDSVKLQSAIDSHFDDIAGLFAAVGKASDSVIAYAAATDKTQPGAYAVTVTQLATQGTVVGSAAAGLTITAVSNDTLNVIVDGVSATVTLGAGTYTASALATEVQSKINGVSAISAAGSSVTVTQSGGILSITSNRYGSASAVGVGGGNGKTNLIGATPTETAGVDVAGTIGGVAAGGSGQFLTGATGSAAEGLKLQVTGGATGSRGTVNYSRGYAYQLDALTTTLLGSSGPVTSRTDGITRSVKDLDNQREMLNRRLVSIEARYRREFTALDSLVARNRSISDFLTQQLASLPKIQ
jgi:flagellar hook-associated protein 2